MNYWAALAIAYLAAGVLTIIVWNLAKSAYRRKP